RTAFLIIWIRRNAAVLPGGCVVLQEDREVAAAVRHVRIAGLRRNERALAIGCRLPFAGADCAAERRTRTGNRAFVLLRAVDVERELIVDRDVIELSRRLIVHRAPRRAAVGRNGRAAV